MNHTAKVARVIPAAGSAEISAAPLAPRGVANALLQIVHAGHYPAAKCGPVTAT